MWLKTTKLDRAQVWLGRVWDQGNGLGFFRLTPSLRITEASSYPVRNPCSSYTHVRELTLLNRAYPHSSYSSFQISLVDTTFLTAGHSVPSNILRVWTFAAFTMLS